jgi:hypothetical protein
MSGKAEEATADATDDDAPFRFEVGERVAVGDESAPFIVRVIGERIECQRELSTDDGWTVSTTPGRVRAWTLDDSLRLRREIAAAIDQARAVVESLQTELAWVVDAFHAVTIARMESEAK